MPVKRSAHVLSSDDIPLDARARALTPYYCASCGDHALTTEANLALVPRRRRDRAYVIDCAKYPTSIACKEHSVIAVKLPNGNVEVQRRFACNGVPIGYRSPGARDELAYVFANAVRAFDYERDRESQRGATSTNENDDFAKKMRIHPPCVRVSSNGKGTLVDCDVERATSSSARGARGVRGISASAVRVSVSAPLHACDEEMKERLASIVGVGNDQVSVTRGRSATARTVFVAGKTPSEVFEALERAMGNDRERTSKILPTK